MGIETLLTDIKEISNISLWNPTILVPINVEN